MDRTKGSVGYSDKFKGKRGVFDRQGSMRADDSMRCSTKLSWGQTFPLDPAEQLRAARCHSECLTPLPIRPFRFGDSYSYEILKPWSTHNSHDLKIFSGPI